MTKADEAIGAVGEAVPAGVLDVVVRELPSQPIAWCAFVRLLRGRVADLARYLS